MESVSDDLSRTDSNLGYRLVKQDIASLKDTITERFDRIDKRLDDHNQTDRDLEKRVSALELIEAKQEGSNFDKRLSALASDNREIRTDIQNLNAFRLKLLGAYAVVSILMGGGAAVLLKLIGAL